MDTEHVDYAIGLILDGVLDKRAVEAVAAECLIEPADAKAVVKAAHKQIRAQSDRPLSWHRANACRLLGESLRCENHRVALEALKELARLDRVHDIGKRLGVKLDGSRQSVVAMLEAAINASLSGDLSDRKLNAIAAALAPLLRAMPEEEVETEYSRVLVSDGTVRSVADDLLKIVNGE